MCHRASYTVAFCSISARIHMIFFGATETYLLTLPSILPRICFCSTSVCRTFNYFLLEDLVSLLNCMIELINKSQFSCCLMCEWAPTLSPIDQSSPNDSCLHRSFFVIYVTCNMVKKIVHDCVHEKGREVLITCVVCSLCRLCSCRQ